MVTSNKRLLELYQQYILNLDNAAEFEDIDSDYLLVLTTRDHLAEAILTPRQQKQLEDLDNQLVNRWQILAQVPPNPNTLDDYSHWWWFLHEGPQARQKAQQATP